MTPDEEQNVYRDLGFDNPEEELAMAKLVRTLGQVIKQRNISIASAAQSIGVDEPEMERLLDGDTTGLSTGKLIHFLTALGQDVEITVRNPKSTSAGTGHLTVATM